MSKEPLEHLRHAIELGGGAGLRQVPGDHNEVPRPGALREPLEVVEELLADGGEPRLLLAHAVVQIARNATIESTRGLLFSAHIRKNRRPRRVHRA